ncbi:MAG: ribbon-helix-helix protein, CopG family [Planctomycetaceae bacterium]|nr:ribbon-helix-helix protein, CopG family [Planctomycetaceae bacterium]
MTKLHRFGIRMSGETIEVIENLAEELGTSDADVIRRAISLYARVKRDGDDHVILEKRENNKVIKKVEIEV